MIMATDVVNKDVDDSGKWRSERGGGGARKGQVTKWTRKASDLVNENRYDSGKWHCELGRRR